MVLAGVGTGWLIAAKQGTAGGIITKGTAGGKQAGVVDESKYKDTAEGILEEGGIKGEGTHHLVRPGGESQTVYLTSTSVDLQYVVGKQVKVWGQTTSARKAGWLLDVGKIKVIE